MTTIVNTPRSDNTDSSLGVIFGVLLAIGLIILFFVYALPALRGERRTDININLPDSISITPNP